MGLVEKIVKQQREYFEKNRDKNRKVESCVETSDYPGGLYLNPEGNCDFKPSYMIFNDIDQLKEMCVPDELATVHGSGNLNLNLKGWNRGKEICETEQLSVLEKADICRAFQQYVYGNSKYAESYRDILNQMYFDKPMLIPVYDCGKMVVKKGTPLVLGSKKEPCISVSYDELIVEEGGEIIAGGDCMVNANRLSSASGSTFSIGVNGTDATDEEGRAQDGGRGNDAVAGNDGKDSCDVSAKDGTRGENGANGANGKNGTSGTDGANVTYKISRMEGIHYVFSYGGNGGNGAKAKDGGNGGSGGDAAKATSYCSKGRPGFGGSGGAGGNGGNGGDGANGGRVEIHYDQSESPDAEIRLLTPEEAQELKKVCGKGGLGGRGGMKGLGGTGGRDFDSSGKLVPSESKYNGVDGCNGENGTPGAPGLPGDIYINGLLIS